MTQQTMTGYACERCGQWFGHGTLACPSCGALVYRQRLEQLAVEATRMEGSNPAMAAMIWRQCLDLLPPQSAQYQLIAQRIGALSSGLAFPSGASAPYAQGPNGNTYAPYAPARQPPQSDSWPKAIFKTGGSMLVSMLFYMILPIFPSATGRVIFGVGLALLILVHEFGHVIAMRYYKLSASPPIFIPFLGALINMRQPPKNAKMEAVVGIGGPVLGTVGALACIAAFLWLRLNPRTELYEVMLTLCYIGVLINLFNLLPFPPLDGGRVTAALSPWMWVLGFAGLVTMMYVGRIGTFIGVLILMMGLPRTIATLRLRAARDNPYYKISRRSAVTIGVVYAALAAGLTALLLWLPEPAMLGG